MWLEGWFKVVLQDNHIGMNHSTHLVDCLETVLAVLYTLLYGGEGERGRREGGREEREREQVVMEVVLI